MFTFTCRGAELIRNSRLGEKVVFGHFALEIALLSAQPQIENQARSGQGSYGRVLYNRHRYYDPSTGRYISSDPIGQAGGVNIFEYARNRPTGFIDPFGLDVWIEGPSGSEPNAHQSINIGDPNGDYVSKSFGVGPGCWTGCVYTDTELGGPIEAYFQTTPEQDAEAIAALDASAAEDSKAYYGVQDTCRTYSQDKYSDLSSVYQNSSSYPPDRPGSPRSFFRKIFSPSGVTSTTSSSPGTSTSR
jgi:RHS repeat-associated protein